MKRPKINVYDFRDKFRNTQNTVFNTLNKLLSMYEYKNFPETFSVRNFELYLHLYGFSINAIAKPRDGVEGLYTFNGGLGGEPDIYHFPTLAIVANPALDKSLNLKIGTECVVVKNDSLLQGTMPIIEKYSSLLAEAELSMLIKIISSRTSTLISASDSRTIQSAKDYLCDLESGKLGVIADNAFLESLKTQPYAGGGAGAENLTDLIEIRQYLRACLNNDLGLPSNYNLKRERISNTESQFDYEALKPFIDDMTKCRKQGIEEINALFGYNIEVELSSSWAQVQQIRPENVEGEDKLNPNTADTDNITIEPIEETYIKEDNDKEEEAPEVDNKDEVTPEESDKSEEATEESDKSEEATEESDKEEEATEESDKEEEGSEESDTRDIDTDTESDTSDTDTENEEDADKEDEEK